MKQLSLFAAALTAALGACTTGDVDPDRMLEPTTFKVRIENVAPWTVLKAGTHETKVTGQAGPLQSGESFEIPFTAGANQRVSFVAMLGQSNDWFFAPKPEGIALYDDAGNPRSGNVTSEIFLFDAGSEIDQEPAVGDATGPRQPAPDFGAPDPIAMVRQLAKTVPLTAGGTFTLPNIADMIQVTLVPGANRQFTLRITNVSTATTLVTSQGSSAIGISPAVWALHIAPAPVFAEGVADRAQGLELVAESGRGAMLGSAMTALAGWHTPISPGVYAVHQDAEPLYALGLPDLDLGLEHLAEDGNAVPLRDALATNARGMQLVATGGFDTPVGAAMPGAARPGSAFELTVSGVPGDRFSFATMFGMSNDWIFATRPEGIALFDADDTARSGDVTSAIAIYDTGWELDQEPAIGSDTGPQQAAPNTGAIDPVRHVREVPASSHGVPASTHLRVTLEPM
ncbi:MAG: spondin domain-containing protein [Kofleriaceae bacterium]